MRWLALCSVVGLVACGDTPLPPEPPPPTGCAATGAEGKACDDKDPCTENDKCTGGACKGTSLTCTTPPPAACKDETTLTIYASPGVCQGGQCSYATAPMDCALGCDLASNTCKGDPCKGVVCDQPPSACHKGTGLCVNGACTYLFDDGKICDDSDACTENDACAAGKCTGTPKLCTTPPANTCKDTATLITYSGQGTCQAGVCDYRPTEVACPSGPCDTATGACKVDPCSGITCTKPPNTCYKSPGTCSAGTCSYDYDDNKTCNDNDACTQTDVCLMGTCKGSPIVCNTPPASKCKDASTVTVYGAPGTCSGGTCTYAQVDVACAFQCDTATGKCKGDPCATNPCTSPPNTQCFSSPGVCSSSSGSPVCTYLPKVGVTCNDNNLCSYGDKCDANGNCAGTAYTCNDSKTCTTDACTGTGGCTYTLDATSCLISNTCYASGAANPSGSCMTCDPAKNKYGWTIAANTCAIANVCYAANATNPSATCMYCNPTTSQTTWAVTAGNCAIGGVCYAANATNPSATCQYCNPTTSQTSWAISAGNCFISSKCYAQGATNPGGACQFCDSTKSQTTWQISPNYCYILSTCYSPNATNPSNTCEYCSITTSTSTWSVTTGTELTSWSFDTGALQGWTVTANPSNPTSPVKWQLDTKRAASPTYSLYFGDVSKHTFDDPGKAVTGDVTSPTVALPSGQGKLCLEFKLWKLTESGGTWDQLTAYVLPANTQVWRSGLEPNNAIVSSSTSPFLTFSANITSFAGQSVQFKFNFNSVDSGVNSMEGTYLDSVRVLTNCTP